MRSATILLLCVFVCGCGSRSDATAVGEGAVSQARDHETTAWSTFLPGSWVVTKSSGWSATSSPSTSKEMLLEHCPNGSESLQSFRADGEGWTRSDYGSSREPCATIIGRETWVPSGAAPTAVVDSKGEFMTKNAGLWSREQRGTATATLVGRKLRTASVRWTKTTDDGSYVIELTHADDVSLPSQSIRVGRHVVDILLPRDVVSYRVEEHGSSGPAQITVGVITDWSGVETVGDEQLGVVIWREQRGADDASLADHAEIHLAEGVPGHVASSRYRREDGSWRTIDLVAYHAARPEDLTPAVATGPWSGWRAGAWVEVETSTGSMSFDASTKPAAIREMATPTTSRARTRLLGATPDGYAVVAERPIGADAGRESIKVIVPPRPLLEQGATEVARSPLTDAPAVFAGSEAVQYQMLDAGKREWQLTVIHRDGARLPHREIFSWFVHGVLPADALGVNAVVQGQSLGCEVEDLGAHRRVADADIAGIVAHEILRSPGLSRRRDLFSSDSIPGVEAWVNEIELKGNAATRTVREVVAYSAGP